MLEYFLCVSNRKIQVMTLGSKLNPSPFPAENCIALLKSWWLSKKDLVINFKVEIMRAHSHT